MRTTSSINLTHNVVLEIGGIASKVVHEIEHSFFVIRRLNDAFLLLKIIQEKQKKQTEKDQSWMAFFFGACGKRGIRFE